MGSDEEKTAASEIRDADQVIPVGACVGDEVHSDINTPKRVRNWRELFGEVGIIVVGVLIALAGEQLVQHLNWQQKIEAVQEAVRDEVLDETLPQAYARVVIARCLGQQLNALRDHASHGADGAQYLALARRYSPPQRTWDTDAQKLADQSDLASHLTNEQITGIARQYRAVANIREGADAERAGLMSLHLNRYGLGALSADDARQISDTIDMLQYSNNRIASFSFRLLQRSQDEMNIVLSAQRKNSVLSEAREVYGNCAGEYVVPPQGLDTRQIRQLSGRGVYAPIAP